MFAKRPSTFREFVYKIKRSFFLTINYVEAYKPRETPHWLRKEHKLRLAHFNVDKTWTDFDASRIKPKMAAK